MTDNKEMYNKGFNAGMDFAEDNQINMVCHVLVSTKKEEYEELMHNKLFIKILSMLLKNSDISDETFNQKLVLAEAASILYENNYTVDDYLAEDKFNFIDRDSITEQANSIIDERPIYG